ncbi:hypothetical protein OXYTRIMIC_439 [Oxytricha trifallax]|uniref:Uncharacterized protein n=1 Tax=Oxytricha trifallax TaxID=1172189 RepID=A0A073I035_9SPIT|nr:hypothetical protein OXYTRIMIC_439 [Oxytricha trifallax]
MILQIYFLIQHNEEIKRYDDFLLSKNQPAIDENTRVKIKLKINLQFKLNRVNIQKLDDSEINKKREVYTNVIISRYLKNQNYEGIKQLYETHTFHTAIAVKILREEIKNLLADDLVFADEEIEHSQRITEVSSLVTLFLTRK